MLPVAHLCRPARTPCLGVQQALTEEADGEPLFEALSLVLRTLSLGKAQLSFRPQPGLDPAGARRQRQRPALAFEALADQLADRGDIAGINRLKIQLGASAGS